MGENNKPLHVTGTEKIARLYEIRELFKGDSAVNQRARLLQAITEYPVSTLEARQYLDILHPAGRIQELRDSAWKIDTVRVAEQTECGKPHNVARYVLLVEVPS